MKDDASDSESGDAESEDDSENSNEEEEYNNPLDWAVSNLHELSKRKEQFEQLCYFTTTPTLANDYKSMHRAYFVVCGQARTSDRLLMRLRAKRGTI